MAAVQGKVTAFNGLTKQSLDGASDSLMATERLNDVWLGGTTWWQGCGELLLQDNCFCKAMAVSQAFIFHFKCISPYASFYAGLSCLTDLQAKTKSLIRKRDGSFFSSRRHQLIDFVFSIFSLWPCLGFSRSTIKAPRNFYGRAARRHKRTKRRIWNDDRFCLVVHPWNQPHSCCN